jgi:hypothetical protein
VDEPSPVVKLTYMILVAAIKKGADKIELRGGVGSECPVYFTVAGVVSEQVRVAAELLAALVRRLAIMADLPTYPVGGQAEGLVQLSIGGAAPACFSIVLSGHGETLAATLFRMAAPPPWVR